MKRRSEKRKAAKQARSQEMAGVLIDVPETQPRNPVNECLDKLHAERTAELDQLTKETEAAKSEIRRKAKAAMDAVKAANPIPEGRGVPPKAQQDGLNKERRVEMVAIQDTENERKAKLNDMTKAFEEKKAKCNQLAQSGLGSFAGSGRSRRNHHIRSKNR
jgi:hypothetical protein